MKFPSKVIDLGEEGVKLYDRLLLYLHATADHRSNYQPVAKFIHKCLVDNLIGFLNIPPLEALENVEQFKNFTLFYEISGIVEIREKDVFSESIKPHLLPLWLKIRSQCPSRIDIQYSYYERVDGLDYVLVRQLPVPQFVRQSLVQEYDNATIERYDAYNS